VEGALKELEKKKKTQKKKPKLSKNSWIPRPKRPRLAIEKSQRKYKKEPRRRGKNGKDTKTKEKGGINKMFTVRSHSNVWRTKCKKEKGGNAAKRRERRGNGDHRKTKLADNGGRNRH